MLPYNSPTEVRALVEERLATAAQQRRGAADVEPETTSRVHGWRKLLAWLIA